MTVLEAEAEYERLVSKQSTPEELAAGYKALVEGMNKINIAYYPLCDNDEQEGDIWP